MNAQVVIDAQRASVRLKSMKKTFDYLIGVDGGGTQTRVMILDSQSQIIATATGAACALGRGRENSWKVILQTIENAFASQKKSLPDLNLCALSLGLSGANNQDWAGEFKNLNPGFAYLSLHTDALTSLWGAYPDGIGLVLALGTGSVGLIRRADGSLQTVSGWGFPAGDEASGAWLGLKVASYLQKVFDGREPENSLFQLVTKEHHWSEADHFLQWLGKASQHEFASLAPYVFQALKQHDPYAQKLLNHTVFEMHKMLDALDPQRKEKFSLCGSIGLSLVEYLDPQTKARHQPPKDSSVVGALNLLKHEVL